MRGLGTRGPLGTVASQIALFAQHGARRSDVQRGKLAPLQRFGGFRPRLGAICAAATPIWDTPLGCDRVRTSHRKRATGRGVLRLRRSPRATRPWLASWMMGMAGCRLRAQGTTSWITRRSSTPGLRGMEGTSYRPPLRAGGGRGPVNVPLLWGSLRAYSVLARWPPSGACGGASPMVAGHRMGWHGYREGGRREVVGRLAAGACPAAAMCPPPRCVWAWGLEAATGNSFCHRKGALQSAGRPPFPAPGR